VTSVSLLSSVEELQPKVKTNTIFKSLIKNAQFRSVIDDLNFKCSHNYIEISEKANVLLQDVKLIYLDTEEA